jgi:hypothetical protein
MLKWIHSHCIKGFLVSTFFYFLDKNRRSVCKRFQGNCVTKQVEQNGRHSTKMIQLAVSLTKIMIASSLSNKTIWRDTGRRNTHKTLRGLMIQHALIYAEFQMMSICGELKSPKWIIFRVESKLLFGWAWVKCVSWGVEIENGSQTDLETNFRCQLSPDGLAKGGGVTPPPFLNLSPPPLPPVPPL